MRAMGGAAASSGFKFSGRDARQVIGARQKRGARLVFWVLGKPLRGVLVDVRDERAAHVGSAKTAGGDEFSVVVGLVSGRVGLRVPAGHVIRAPMTAHGGRGRDLALDVDFHGLADFPNPNAAPNVGGNGLSGAGALNRHGGPASRVLHADPLRRIGPVAARLMPAVLDDHGRPFDAGPLALKAFLLPVGRVFQLHAGVDGGQRGKGGHGANRAAFHQGFLCRMHGEPRIGVAVFRDNRRVSLYFRANQAVAQGNWRPFAKNNGIESRSKNLGLGIGSPLSGVLANAWDEGVQGRRVVRVGCRRVRRRRRRFVAQGRFARAGPQGVPGFCCVGGQFFSG